MERLHNGSPLLEPAGSGWESGVTFNSAALYLERSAENDPLLRTLLETDDLETPDFQDGIVVLHYRARPQQDPGFRWNRSFVGLALFTPELKLLRRLPDPVLSPGTDADSPDYLGVEDPRTLRIGDDFYMVYCGIPNFPEGSDWKASNCLAISRDLIHWERLGPMPGEVQEHSNKDGVLFPEPINGTYFLLHRPMVGPLSQFSIQLAVSKNLTGPWRNCGPILRADRELMARESWVGAGSVPIPLGNNRFLEIYHTGNYLCVGGREYDLDAVIFNMDRFSPENPSAIVEKRLTRILIPETEYEIGAPFADSVANVVFTCGSYVYGEHLYIVYGGGDTCIMGARVHLAELIARVEASDLPPQTF